MSGLGPSAAPEARGARPDVRAALALAAGVVALALVLRLWHRFTSVVIGSDGPVFLRLARAAAERDWSAVFSHPYHPLYPLATAAVQELGVGLETAAVAVSIASGTAAVGLLFAFLYGAFGVRTAAIGAGLLAVNSYAVSFSSDVLSEGLYLALLLGAVVALWHALRREHAGWALAAGALSGLAYLTRPEGLVVVVVGIGLAALRVLEPARRAAGLRVAAALALGGALLVTPYVVVLHAHHGVLLLTPKKSIAGLLGTADAVIPEAVARANAPPFLRRVQTASAPHPLDSGDGSRAPAPSGTTSTPPPHFERLPAAPPPAWPRPALRHLAALREVADRMGSSAPWEVVPFLLLGVVALRGRPSARGRLVLGLVAVYAAALYALAFSAGYLSRRHGLPPVVVSMGYAAVGLTTAAHWLGGRLAAGGPPAAAPRRVALALLLGAIAVGALVRIGGAHRGDRRAEREAAEWVAERLETGEAVAARRERVAYYARAPFVALRHAPRENFTDYLRHLGVRYVIVDEPKIERYPGLRREAGTLSRLRAIEREGRRVIVFEVPAAGARRAGDAAGTAGDG